MKTIKDIEKAAIDLYENLEMNSILINRRKIDAIIKGVRAMQNKAVAYLCDGKKCEKCSSECKHTLDIKHAVNFENSGYDGEGDVLYFEKESSLLLIKAEPPKESGWYYTTVWTGEELSTIEAYYNVQDNSWIVDGFDLIGVLTWAPMQTKRIVKNAEEMFAELGFESGINGHYLTYEKRVPERDCAYAKNNVIYVEFNILGIDYDYCWEYIDEKNKKQIEAEDFDPQVFKAIYHKMCELGWIE